MKPQTTNKLYEDTNYLQRKVVYRGSVTHVFTYNAAFNVYQSLIIDTQNIFSHSNNNFSFDYFVTYNDGSGNKMLQNDYVDIDTTIGSPNIYSYTGLYQTTGSDGLQYLNAYATVTLDTDPGSTVYKTYYVLYSARIVDTEI